MRWYYFLLFTSICMGELVEDGDREVLEPFFRTLLCKSELGFVLLGAKPVMRTSYTDHLSWWHPIASLGAIIPYFDKGNQYHKRSWGVWRKYFEKMSDKFLIVEEKHSPLVTSIYVIHRELFCKVVNENQEDFERVLGIKVTGEDLLEKARDQPLFSALLNNNEFLLGMLLGFGKNNARLYSEKKMHSLGCFPLEEDDVGPIELPAFRANWDDPETTLLREKYLKCRRRIKQRFLDQDAYGEVLKILFSP